MKNTKKLDVFIDGLKVGVLAMTPDHRAAFQYSSGWLKNGFSLSPFSLPLDGKVYIPGNMNCSGLFGVFEDSLPDAWGRLLVDRALGKRGIHPGSLNVLDRLAIVGENGIGDLEYRPSEHFEEEIGTSLSLDDIQEQCSRVLKSEDAKNLDTLFRLGGSTGGTRPKIYLPVGGKEWMIKFQTRHDIQNSGLMEYRYAQCAVKCGIPMSRTRLFPSHICKGYFGSERFDRTGGLKEHVVTVKGLLELAFDQPSLDYSSLLRMTDILTCHNEKQILQMFRLACFNVFGHNQDDHSKNFSFMYGKQTGIWKLAPAYDLTFSTTAYNEHTTSVNYNGRNPGKKELLEIALQNGIPAGKAAEIIDQIRDFVQSDLNEYVNNI